MGFFDALTDGAFKKDSQNNTVFYPMGVLGKGYILPDAAREAQIRGFLKKYYALIFVFVLVGILVRPLFLWSIAGLLGLCIWFFWIKQRLLKDCTISTDKLAAKEAYGNAAKGMPLWLLWLFAAVSALAVLMGVMLLINGKALLGIFFIVLFGACTFAYGYMIRAKKRQQILPPPN